MKWRRRRTYRLWRQVDEMALACINFTSEEEQRKAAEWMVEGLNRNWAHFLKRGKNFGLEAVKA